MTHQILHIIGLCPDSMSHIDLIDIYLNSQNNLFQLLSNIIKYFKKK